MGLLDKVESAVSLGILAVVGYVFLVNYDTLKEIWCKIPGVCGISDCTLTAKDCWQKNGPYSEVDVKNCKCTGSEIIIDEHGCKIGAPYYQHWCETTGRCQDAASKCPEPPDVCDPCPSGMFRPYNDCDYPCMYGGGEDKPCSVDNGIGGDLYNCPDGSQVCHSIDCPHTPGECRGSCICKSGIYPAECDTYSGCGEQCDVKDQSKDGGEGLPYCVNSNYWGNEDPPGSKCYPYACDPHANVDCMLRCSDVGGNYRSCQDPECPPHYVWVPQIERCSYLPDQDECSWKVCGVGQYCADGMCWDQG